MTITRRIFLLSAGAISIAGPQPSNPTIARLIDDVVAQIKNSIFGCMRTARVLDIDGAVLGECPVADLRVAVQIARAGLGHALKIFDEQNNELLYFTFNQQVIGGDTVRVNLGELEIT